MESETVALTKLSKPCQQGQQTLNSICILKYDLEAAIVMWI